MLCGGSATTRSTLWGRSRAGELDSNTEESGFGKFGWCMDPEGNRVELWEPPARQ